MLHAEVSHTILKVSLIGVAFFEGLLKPYISSHVAYDFSIDFLSLYRSDMVMAFLRFILL